MALEAARLLETATPVGMVTEQARRLRCAAI
jgi:hypothetical protein